MFKFKKYNQKIYLQLLFKLLISFATLIFLIPMLLGIVNKYFPLINLPLIIYTSAISIILGVLGFTSTIIILFNILFWSDL